MSDTDDKRVAIPILTDDVPVTMPDLPLKRVINVAALVL